MSQHTILSSYSSPYQQFNDELNYHTYSTPIQNDSSDTNTNINVAIMHTRKKKVALADNTESMKTIIYHTPASCVDNRMNLMATKARVYEC